MFALMLQCFVIGVNVYAGSCVYATCAAERTPLFVFTQHQIFFNKTEEFTYLKFILP